MSGFTRIPNEIIDEHLPTLSCGELRVFLFICRQTVGWNKETDSMSLKQLMDGIGDANKGTGLTKKSVLAALKGLDEKDLVKHERQENDRLGHVASRYSLASNLYQACSKKDTTLGGESITRVGVETTTSPCDTNDPTQKTVEQKTLPKDISAKDSPAADAPTEVQAVCGKLGLKGDFDAEELIERGIASVPGTEHLARAIRCKNHYPNWSKKKDIEKAGHYWNFCEREKTGQTASNGKSHLHVVDRKAQDHIDQDEQERFNQRNAVKVAAALARRAGGPSAAAQ